MYITLFTNTPPGMAARGDAVNWLQIDALYVVFSLIYI